MRRTMKKKIFRVVNNVVNSLPDATHEDRAEIARVASQKLSKIGINCARDDIKAGDYLSDAIDHYLY
jgi:isopentenyl diphosphate isomerase/L-lactate dehydrogenase-like FMN-dependent dehydrogenase